MAGGPKIPVFGGRHLLKSVREEDTFRRIEEAHRGKEEE